MAFYGIVQMFLSTSLPSGWLALDGNSFDKFEYPDLYGFLGSNYLPDFGKRFPRAVGSFFSISPLDTEEDTFKSHTHLQSEHNHLQDEHRHPSYFNIVSGGTSSDTVRSVKSSPGYTTSTGYTTATNQATTATNQATGGTETRPKSVYLIFAIYAKEGYPLETKIDQILEICQKFDKSYSANENEFHLSDELLNLCQTWFWSGQSRGG